MSAAPSFRNSASRGMPPNPNSSPQISFVSAACLPPGGTGQVVIRGKFPPGTRFVFENDSIEVLNENLAGGEYRATLKAAPGIGPQSAGVMAITPATCLTARSDRAAVVGGSYEWTLDAANGWKIVARSKAGGCSERGDAPYDVQFFRNGEAAPFEKRAATLSHSVYDRENFRFTISSQDPQMQSRQEDAQALMKRMMDPNLSPAERDRLLRQIQQAQEQMMATAKKMTDPNYMKQLQAQQEQFGCERIRLEESAGAVKGRLNCSEKAGRQIAVTGTMKYLAK